MEAVALHDFTATADDELSFRKGEVLKVKTTMLSQLLIVHIHNLIPFNISITTI